MIISKLLINNFRSYYGEKIFEFKNGLNLILGSNGDGKTTFYDALEFVLSEQQGMRPENLISYASAKMIGLMNPNEAGKVKVVIEMRNNDNQRRCIERSFEILKTEDNLLKVQKYNHTGYIGSGLNRKTTTVSALLQGEALFPAVIKKYSLFKGERSLNIFEDKTTLQNLINLFSDIKDMEPYKAFGQFAETTSNMAISHAQKKSKQTNQKANKLLRERRELESKLAKQQNRLDELRNRHSETNSKIEAIEADLETIELVHTMQDAIRQTEQEIEREKRDLNENFTFNLLDEQWILKGFMPILNQFADKMNHFSEQKQILINLDREAKIRKKTEKEIAKKTIEEMKAKLSLLPWYIPDIKTMQSMLDKERCLVCGTEAKKGSAAYQHIAQHLQEALDHIENEKNITKPEIKEEEPLFCRRNIENLHQLSIQLLQYGVNLKGIQREIDRVKQTNAKIYANIESKQLNIDNIRTKMAQILAQAGSGNDIGNMANNWTNIKHWYALKEEDSVEMDRLVNNSIPELKEKIKNNVDAYKKFAGNNSAAQELLRINDFFRLFSGALENAEERSLEEFMDLLAETANRFLAMLNVDDFTGVIKIYRDIRDHAVRVKLVDKSGKVIETPNTSLYTTMHLSVLFAISELTKDNLNNEYPIILDAPTSSFDEGKDKNFYQVMNEKLDKQCIIVTKSFLIKNEQSGRFEIDEKGLHKLIAHKQIPVYRIEKLAGYDKQDLSSIETMVTPLY